jgi:hypothetical protein
MLRSVLEGKKNVLSECCIRREVMKDVGHGKEIGAKADGKPKSQSKKLSAIR